MEEVDEPMLFDQDTPMDSAESGQNGRVCRLKEPVLRRLKMRRLEVLRDGLRTTQVILARRQVRVRVISKNGERDRRKRDTNLGHHSKIWTSGSCLSG